MLDITKFRSADTFVLNLKDPEGNTLYGEKDKPLGVELYGKGSSDFNVASEKFAKEITKLRAKWKDFEKIPVEDIKSNKIAFMTACTVKLVGFTYKELQGDEAKKAFYADSQLGFMHEQIDAELGKWRMADGKN